MKHKPLVRATKLLLDVLFWCGCAATLSVPFVFRWAGNWFPTLVTHYWVQVVLVMLAGVGAVVILFELRRMFATVLAEDCFVRGNVASLRRMGWVSFAISLLALIRMILVLTPATILVMLVFFIAGLFSLVLAEVFDKAVSYKEENDLTI